MADREKRTRYIWTAEDRTRQAVDSAVRGISRLDERVLGLRSAFIGLGGALSLTSLGAMVRSVANVQDEIGKLSQKVGVSVESLSALKHAANLSDVSLDSLGTGLRQLARNMADTQAGTGEARDAFQALGISVVDGSGKLKGTEQQLVELADKFAGMEDGAGKTALAMRIFGRAGADLIPLLNQGSAGLQAMRQEAERLGIVFSADAAAAAERFNDNLTRLSASAQGLTFRLAGPLVEALGHATTAMLEAAQRGESLLSVFSQGLATAIWGNDLHRNNVEISQLTDKLVRLQDIGDMLRRRPLTLMNQGLIEANKKAVEETRAEIEKLVKRSAILAPEAPGGGGRGGGAAAPGLPGAGDARERDFVTRQIQEGLEEEMRIRQEVDALIVAQRDKQLADERTREEARIQILVEAFDLEQEELIRQGEIRLQYANEHQRQLADIERRGIKSRSDWENATNMQRAQSVFGYLADVTAGVAQHNRALFEINKVAGIANAIVSTHAGIAKTLEVYPWPLAGILAAVHAAAGFAQVSAISKAQFGGGGGAVAPSLVGGTPALPVTPVESGSPVDARQQRLETRVVILASSKLQRQVAEEIADGLNELHKDGYPMIFAVESA